MVLFFFFNQKTAYEMRISDWSSDVCSSDLETFADNLQKEIEADTGIRFGIVEQHQFAAIPIQKDDGTLTMLGFEESTSIFDFLKAEQMIDARGKVQDKLRQALKEGTLTLPPEYAAHLPQVKEVLQMDRKSTRLNSSHSCASRMPSSA